ncbi:MAG: PqqD family protein [Erythrobacter sp.]|jgi:hypothetical protein|nr:PqqD family protein [Erythrobacter sp.]
MSDVLQENWRPSDDAIANPVGGETVILHLGNGTYYGLDTIGSILWEGLKAGQRPSDVCERILEEYEVERETLENDLRQFLSELADNELVVRT